MAFVVKKDLEKMMGTNLRIMMLTYSKKFFDYGRCGQKKD